jgi:hypothetical protein
MKEKTSDDSQADASTQRGTYDEYNCFVSNGCTCDVPSEFNKPDNFPQHRHEYHCNLLPNLDTWLFYPIAVYDIEHEHGGGDGVYVNPKDKSLIYLEIDGYLCPAALADQT